MGTPITFQLHRLIPSSNHIPITVPWNSDWNAMGMWLAFPPCDNSLDNWPIVHQQKVMKKQEQSKEGLQCQSKELHQTLGGYYGIIDYSREILRVPTSLHFFSEFHFCYFYCCAGFSFLSGDVNVRRCRFSEIAIHHSSQFLSNIDRKEIFLFIPPGAPLSDV